MQITTDEIKRIDQFTSDLLNLSKRSTQVMETDINELIKTLLFFVSYQFKVSNVKCQTELGDIPEIRVNPFELGQAILNILNNAIEAMSSGGILSIKTHKDLLFGKEFVFLEISDTGPGIASEQQRRVDAPHPNEKGKGFGLLISRKIIENHGGNLLIESKKGVGTSVCICLPVSCKGETNESSKE
ncbi:MAG: GHKL domain-containing protein [Deltaproteobacteria bacterium]|nr:GHKL domain-containing protein [Deltaproteobacteria bacterium]MBW2150032.1 GHKL domain-containing protein [Deltaproteobacteria bacterium]